MRLLFLIALLAATVWLIVKSLPGRRDGTLGEKKAKLAQDPVCKTYIPESTAITVEREGKRYFFCSERCAEAFRSGPGKES